MCTTGTSETYGSIMFPHPLSNSKACTSDIYRYKAHDLVLIQMWNTCSCFGNFLFWSYKTLKTFSTSNRWMDSSEFHPCCLLLRNSRQLWNI